MASALAALAPVPLLYAARQCGFDDLLEPSLPAIVVLHGNQYRILESFHTDRVTLNGPPPLRRAPLLVLTGPKPRILPEMATGEMLDTLAALEPAA